MGEWQKSLDNMETATQDSPTFMLLGETDKRTPTSSQHLLSRSLFYARQSWREASTKPRRALLRSIFNYPARGAQLRRTAWLDGLRGLAALEVYIFHYCDGWFDRTLSYGAEGYHARQRWYYLPFVRSVYGSGDTAVALFFIISGYVLSQGLLVQLRQGNMEQLIHKLSSAIMRRAIRLYTPVLVLTFLLMILSRLGMPKASPYEDQPTFVGELQAWFWSFNWLQMPLTRACKIERSLNRYDGGISWTIPSEYDGSLHVYASILFLSRVRNIKVRRALCIFWVLHRFSREDWSAALFISGMLFADLHLERSTQHCAKDPSPTKQTAILAMLVFGVFLSGLPPMFKDEARAVGVESRLFYNWLTDPIAAKEGWYVHGPERYFSCLSGLLVFTAFSELPRLRWVTEARFVQYLGKISFGIYLCHIFVRAWMSPWKAISLTAFGVDPNDQNAAPRTHQFGAYLMFMIPTTAVIFLIGGFFQRTLDSWSIQLGKWFEEQCIAYNRDVPVAGVHQLGPPENRLS